MTTNTRRSIIESRINADRYAASQGFRLGDVTDETVEVTVEVTEQHLNFHSVMHGGALFSLADCAFSLASNAYDEAALAIDTHLALTAPTHLGDTLSAVAHEIVRGRTLATYRVDITRGDGRIVGLFTGTVIIRS